MAFIIPYQKYRFTIEAVETLSLPYYKGSTFRGGFGSTFKRIVCALKKKECIECMLSAKCIYAYVFETTPYENSDIMGMKKYEKIPHPFIIEPPIDTSRIYEAGELVAFSLILIGKATEYLPYFIYTFDELGKIGIGKYRGKYTLKRVEINGEVQYSSENKTIKYIDNQNISLPEDFLFGRYSEKTITLQFLTPVRISYQRRLTGDLRFHILIRNLLRRINLLHYFHCDKTTPLWDHRYLINKAEDIVTTKNILRWWDWQRYSTRQKEKMKMGGVIGQIEYTGDLEPFIPVLKAGEILHVGKGTSFGLGKYEILPFSNAEMYDK